MFVNRLHNLSLDFHIFTTVAHSSKIVKMSIGKLKVNFGANISSMFLSETVLWTSFWILSGVILAPFWDIFWVRKWVEALQKEPKRRSWPQTLKSSMQTLNSLLQTLKSIGPTEAFHGSSRRLGDGSGGPWCVFWSKVCPKRVPKGCPKGVKRELKNRTTAKYGKCGFDTVFIRFGPRRHSQKS